VLENNDWGTSASRQFLVALLIGGGGSSSGAYPYCLETSVHSPGDASAQKHCQGRDGKTHGGSFVLDVAERLTIRHH
jgi:hypothetical protein